MDRSVAAVDKHRDHSRLKPLEVSEFNTPTAPHGPVCPEFDIRDCPVCPDLRYLRKKNTSCLQGLKDAECCMCTCLFHNVATVLHHDHADFGESAGEIQKKNTHRSRCASQPRMIRGKHSHFISSSGVENWLLGWTMFTRASWVAYNIYKQK